MWADGSPVCDFQNSITFDGYTYDLVAIGDKCWFKENLRTEHYANENEIPGNLSNSEWSSTSSGAGGGQAIYGNNIAFLESYGRLYNWYAVDDSRGLCPSDWQVTTDGDWITLEMELGMIESEANSTGWRGTDQGTPMKSSPSDIHSWDYSNTSGFSALPGGMRLYYSGYFDNVGNNGFWWSASPDGASYTWYRVLYPDRDIVSGASNPQRNGFSVRRVRDE